MTRQEALRQLQKAADALRLVASGSFSLRGEAAQLYGMKREVDRIAAEMADREEVSE